MVEVSYLVHSTEDAEKIAVAVSQVMGVRGVVTGTSMDGHYGNRIALVGCRADGEEAASILKRVSEIMPKALRARLAEEMDDMVDEHSTLYLRFDKQALVLGRLEAGGNETVRVRVRPGGYLPRENARDFHLRLLGGGSS